VLIATDAAGDYPEIDWIGRRLRLGSALLEVVAGCPRCVMVTQPFADLPQDYSIMRTLVRETKHLAGVYAQVVMEGTVRSEDAVELVE
jgi:MOSC domain-containing protein YiiM